MERLDVLPQLQKSVDSLAIMKDDIASINSTTTEMKQTVNTMSKTITSLTSSVEFTQSQVDDVTKELKETKACNVDLKTRITTLEERCLCLERKNDKIDTFILGQDQINRRRSFIITGLTEKEDENIDMLVADIISHIGFPKDQLVIDKSFRVGDKQPHHTREVLVIMVQQSHVECILRSASKLRNSPTYRGVWINPDLTSSQRQQRAEMRAVHLHAKQSGAQSSIRGDSISINGMRYRYNDLAKLPPNLSLKAAKTKETPSGLAFNSPNAPLSNFYTASFKWNGNITQQSRPTRLRKPAITITMPSQRK